MDVEVAQPIAQKTTVREVLGSTLCLAASLAAVVKTFKDGFMDIHISLLSDDGHKTLLTYF